MKFFVRSLQVIFALGCALLLFVGLDRGLDSVVLITGDPTRGWVNMINLHHNAFTSWRYDHLTQLLLRLIPGEDTAEKPFCSLFILLIGAFFLSQTTRKAEGTRNAPALIVSIIPGGLMLLTVGADPFVFGSLCWIPFLTAISARLFANPNSKILWIILGLVSLENSFSANQLSLIAGTVAIILGYTICRSLVSEQQPSRDTWFWLGVIVLLPAIITTVSIPMPSFPKYPSDSHLVPDTSFEPASHALIGPTYPFKSMSSDAARQLYICAAYTLSVLCVLMWCFACVRYHPLLRKVAKASLILAVCALLDTTLPAKWAAIAPIASASRLLPWATNYSLTAIALGLSACGAGYIAAVSHYKRVSSLALIASLFLLFTDDVQELFHPYLRLHSLTSDPSLRPILATPSAGMIRAFHPDHPQTREWLKKVASLSKNSTTELTKLGATVQISPEPTSKITELTTQAEKDFRWSTRTGQQKGDEVLTIRFPSPTRVRGIELDPGGYTTDYPRGLKIVGGDCADEAQRQVLFLAPVWQGTIKFTKSGAPYFSPRHEVKAFFTEATPVTCLFVHQIGQTRTNDWSVARVSIVQ